MMTGTSVYINGNVVRQYTKISLASHDTNLLRIN